MAVQWKAKHRVGAVPGTNAVQRMVPVVPENGQERFQAEYRKRNLTTVLYALLLASTVVSLVAIFGPWLEPGTRYSVTISCFVYLALIWLNRKGYGSVAGVIAVLTLIFVANFGLSIGRGFRDESMLIFPGVLIFSSLILNRIVYGIVTAFVILNVIVVGLLDVNGHFQHVVGNTANYGEIVTASMIVGGIAIAVYLLINSLFRSLRRAESSRYQFRSIFDSSPDGVVIMDFDGTIRQVNRKARRLFQRNSDDILSGNFNEFLRESDAERFATLVRDLEAGIGPDREFEAQLVVGDDRARTVQISGWLVTDPISKPLAVGVFLIDVSETRELEAEKSTLEKTAFPCPESRSDRDVGRRYRARLQQHPRRHPRVCGSRGDRIEGQSGRQRLLDEDQRCRPAGQSARSTDSPLQPTREGGARSDLPYGRDQGGIEAHRVHVPGHHRDSGVVSRDPRDDPG